MKLRHILTTISLTVILSGVAQIPGNQPVQPERFSPLTKGYLERALKMYDEGNYLGTIDQLTDIGLVSQNEAPSLKARCQYLLGMALYERGDKECVRVLRSFATEYPELSEAVEAQLTIADFYFYQGDYREALECYNEISFSALSSSEHAKYDCRKGICLIKTGYLGEARTLFERLKTNSRYENPAKFYLAYIDYAEGRLPDSYRRFEELSKNASALHKEGLFPEFYLVQMDYSRELYQQVISRGVSLLADNPPLDLIPETQRVVGLSLYKTGELSEAAQYLEQYVATHDYAPGADAFYTLGVIYYKERNYDDAGLMFARVENEDNRIGQSASFYLGQIAEREGDNRGAVLYFSRASEMDYDNSVTEAAIYNYLTARNAGGKIPFKDDVPLMESFIKRFPDSRYASKMEEFLASVYFNDHNYQKALSTINLIQNPSREILEMKQNILYRRGVQLMSNNSPAAATDYLKESIAIGIDDDLRNNAYIWLGDSYFDCKEWNRAADAYLAYLKNAPRGDDRALACYDLAYTYMSQDKFNDAAIYFQKALQERPALQKNLQDDALIRMGDARYYTGDYNVALKHYTDAVNNGSTASDYAAYRRAVMLGLKNDNAAKIKELIAFSNTYPASRWTPDVLFELAETYSAGGDLKNADKYYSQLEKQFGNNPRARQGRLNMGIAYLEKGENAKGVETLKDLIRKWPTSEEAAMANDDLIQYYTTNGNIEEYLSFLNSTEGAPKPDADKVEEMYFQSAASEYSVGGGSIAPMERYIEKYPDGKYLSTALINIATARLEEGDSEGALRAAESLIELRKDSPELPEALLIKAQVLETSSPSKALEAYKSLEKTGIVDYLPDAYYGIMKTTGNNSERLKYAGLLKNSSGVPADKMEEAELHEALAILESDSKTAVATLQKLARNPNSPAGARAAVELGTFYINNGKTAEAEKVLTIFTESDTTHDYWLARGFISLADVYHLKGKDYIAVEYLKSLQESYPGKEKDIQSMISERLAKWNKR